MSASCASYSSWAWPCRTSLTRLWLPSSFAKSWTCCKRSSMSSIMTSLSSGRETNRSALPWSMFSWIVPITSDISECSCLRFLMILCVVAGSMVMVTRSGSRSSLVTCFYTRWLVATRDGLFWLAAGCFSDVVSDALARDDQRLDEALEPSFLYLVRGIAATKFCGKYRLTWKAKALVVSSAMLL